MSPPAIEFEKLVARILEDQGFELTPQVKVRNFRFDYTADLVKTRWAIEIAYYRTARAQPSLIQTAASKLQIHAKAAGIEKGMLVVSCILPAPLRQQFEEDTGLVFVDRTDLAIMASRDASLLAELESLLEIDPSVPSLISSDGPYAGVDFSVARKIKTEKRPEDRQGTALATELRALDPGKGTWKKYEELCARILRYLFPNDLHGWHAQKRTDDGLNRYDFVCRIRPTTEFWQFLLQHLDSRYVMFEFKNYTGKIKQGQVLTTEKYLLERGLRRVAVIFSRKGSDSNALTMTQGAMREHGKLMLILDDAKVCEMLAVKEKGGDPTDTLFTLADEFLLRLPR